MNLSDFEYAYSIYSDTFKDLCGFRPRTYTFWEHEGLDALNPRIDFLQARLEARLEAQREEEADYWHDCPHLEDESLADREAEEWADDERQLARDAQRAEEALELQWVQWEVLEMDLMGLRHR